MKANPVVSTAIALTLLLVAVLLAAVAWQRAGRPAATVADVTTPAPTATTASAVATAPAGATATVTVSAVAPISDPATATPTPSVTPSSTATSLPPTATATATPTPAPTMRSFPTLDPRFEAATAVPTPVPPFEKPDSVTTILLLGNDVSTVRGGRTDSIVLVAIDTETQTATMLSFPRDLYVAIPGWRMTRINQALPHGHGSAYPGGGGGLVKDTILYNFGLPVDYYVRIGFDGFVQAVDALEGIEVAVSCPVNDWRLKSPELDPQEEENWEEFELGPGVYRMDGDLALWYVRSRRSSSDFERGRRQQQILRAILNRGLDLDVLTRAPSLWEAYGDSVETDLSLRALLRLAALAPTVRDNGIQHLYLAEAVRPWTTPGGGAVQLLQWEEAMPVLAQVMQPPALNQGTRPPLTVKIVTGDDVRYRLAAENALTHGFAPVRGRTDGPAPAETQITYFGPNFKGSFNWLLGWVFDVAPEEIVLDGDSRSGDPFYRVVVGANYDPCRPELEAPLSPDAAP